MKEKLHCWVVLDENNELIGVSLSDSKEDALEDMEEFTDEGTKVVRGITTYNLPKPL